MTFRIEVPVQLTLIICSILITLALSSSAMSQGKIAFVSTRDGDNEIYIMNADGTGQTRVTSRSFSDFDPSLSWDGGTIVYVSNEGTSQIFTTNLDGSNQNALTSIGSNFDPCISPNRRSIVFTTGRDGNNRIYKMNYDGSNQTPLTSSSLSSVDPCYSLDGSKIVFASSQGGFNDIYIMNSDGSGQPNQLTTNGADDLEPMFSPDGTKIVFRSNRDGNNEIYIMNADGSNQVRLTQNSADDSEPVFSPDGTKIAFNSNRGGNYQIYLMNADGSSQVSLTGNPAYTNFSPSWVDPSLAPPALTDLGVNPTQITEGSSTTLSGNILNPNSTLPLTLTINWGDGSPTQILNYAGNTTSFAVPHQYLDGLPLDTPIGVTVSTTNGLDSGSVPVTVFEGSPSVDSLLVNGVAAINTNVKLTGFISDPGVLDIHNVDIDWGDGSAHTILDLGPGVNSFISNHAYSSLGIFTIHVAVNDGQLAAGMSRTIGIVPPPTSGKVAFTSNYGGNNNIWLMNSNGTGQIALTTNPASDAYPNLSKDGSKIVFSSDRDGNQEIYSMNAVGSFQTRLTNNAGIDTTPVFSPDGTKIVFASNRDGNYEIYIMNANGTGQTRLTNNALDDGQATFSPDGTKIYFVRLASNQSDSHIWSMDLNGANQVALTSGSFILNGQPNFSPNGQKIVFSSVRPFSGISQPEIFIMDANGANQTRLTNAAGQDLEPVFSPDGTKIAFRSERDGNPEIYLMDADGTNQQRITFDGTGVSNFAPSWAAVSTVSVDIDDNLATESGTTLTVPIIVTDTTGKGIISYDFTLNYDPAVLVPQAVAFDKVSTLSAGLTINAGVSMPGKLVVSGFGSVPLTGPGTLLQLKFDVVGTAPTSSDLTLSPFMFNEGIPFSDLAGGHVFVQGTIDGRVTYGTAATTVGVPNVTMFAAGSPNTTTTTAANGNYHLGAFGPGAYTVTPSKTGDAGGINALDASLISQFLVGATTLTANQQAAGEVSGNGTLTSFDAALIAQYVALLPNTGYTGTWRFLPASRTYESVGSLINEDYAAILMGEVSGDWSAALAASSAKLITSTGKTVESGVNERLARPIVPSATVALGSGKVKQNQLITIPISLKFSGPVAQVQAYQFDVLFDPKVVQPDVTAATTTGTLSSSFSVVTNPNTPGRLRVVVYGASAISSNGTLINLVFRAVGRANSSTNLSFANLLLNEGSPVADGKSGKITVSR